MTKITKTFIAKNMRINYSQNKATMEGCTDITWYSGQRPSKTELVDEFYRELNRGNL